MTRRNVAAVLFALLAALGLMYCYLYLASAPFTWNPDPFLKALQDSWSTGIGISVTANVVLILIILTLFKWRQSVGNGMMAVVPSELLSTVRSWSKQLDLNDKKTETAFAKIASAFDDTKRQIPSIAQSIQILKTALDEKDLELAALRGVRRSEEHIALGKKAIRLYQMTTGLKASIERGQVSESVALQFLADELMAVFDDLSIEMINPSIGTPLAGTYPDSVSVKEAIAVDDPQLHNSIAKVLESGFAFKLPANKLSVVRPAVVIINSCGGPNGDRRH